MKAETEEKNHISRRKFLGNAAALSAFFIVPRHVLGGKGFIAPSDMITLGFIGAGRQANSLQRSFLNTGEGKIIGVSPSPKGTFSPKFFFLSFT